MKKLLIPIAAIVVIAVAGYFVAQSLRLNELETENSLTSDIKWATYQSQFGFSFEYPEGWEINELPRGPVQIIDILDRDYNENEDGRGGFTPYYKQEIYLHTMKPKNLSLQEYIFQNDQYEGENLTATKLMPVIINGLTWQKRESTFGGFLTSEEYYIEIEKDLYSTSNGYRESERYNSIFQHILRSIKFN